MSLQRIVILGLIPACALALCASEPNTDPRENPAKAALEEFQDLIGGWRGVGQPVRGSTKDAWQETADWAWSFKDKQPALVYSIEKGKLLTSARLTYDPEYKVYLIKATYADESEREFSGTLEQKTLQLVSKPDAEGEIHRLTITRLNEKRTLVLLERSIAADRYFRIAEVGYTREGTRLAVAGADGPECVVTGGKATMPVSYMGKTYYVCCTGCKQAFDDDPAGILADYEAKVAARKAKAK
ncbi:MAG TPA: hypothetical protein VMM56_14360 [Planctomycetaceae bacterium]|nr:hypothetical protein [Planctomycetaceae bacterium]